MAAPHALAVTDPNAVADDRSIPTEHIGTIAPNHWCRGWNAKRVKYCGARAGWGTDHAGSGRCKHHGGNTPVQHGQRRRYTSLAGAPHLQTLIERYQEDDAPLDVLHDLAVARALMHDWLDRYAVFTAAITAWYDTWEGKYAPLPEAEKTALLHALDEYEQLLRTTSAEPTEQQLGGLELARSAITFLSIQQAPKPRQLLDVADAVRHVDTISKVITRAEQVRAHGTVSIARLRMFLLALDRVVELEVPDLEQRIRIRRQIHTIRV